MVVTARDVYLGLIIDYIVVVVKFMIKFYFSFIEIKENAILYIKISHYYNLFIFKSNC